MAEWRTKINGLEQGPFTGEQLLQFAASGRLGPQDQVWRHGLADWIAAGSVPQLAALFAAGHGHPGGAGASHRDVLSYATPEAVEEALPPRHVPLPTDPGPFMDFGRRMTTPRAGWGGRLVVSPVAFYFLKLFSKNSDVDDIRTCSIADLAPAIRERLDPKGKHAKRDVIVLPRTAITRITLTTIHASSIIIHQATYHFFVGMFTIRRSRDFLQQHGWKLDTDLIPTTAPIQAQSLGRSLGQPPRPSKAGRAVGIIIAIIAICISLAMLVLKIFMALNHR